METDTLRFPHLWEALQKYGAEAQRLYKEKLTQQGKNASKELFNSVQFEVRQDGTTYQVGLNLAFYWKFVEGGTKGKKYPDALCRQHFPPVSAIQRWIEVKPVVPRAGANGKIPTPNQLAYLISRKIAEDGIKPAPILAETSEEVFAQFSERVEEAFMQDVASMGDFVMSPFVGLNTNNG